jgi:hypothetical protein
MRRDPNVVFTQCHHVGIWGWFSDLGTVQMALDKNRSTINNWLVVTGT